MELYGLVGLTLVHSFSRDYFTRRFSAEGRDADYRNFELPDIGLLLELIDRHPDLRGLNVTIPYKQQVIPLLDSLDPTAAAIGAVNTIGFLPPVTPGAPRRLRGYNTDAPAFAASLAPMLAGGNHRRALILGTGGASLAVAHALRSLALEASFVSRRAGRADFTYADLTPDVVGAHTVVVNATPCGTWPDVDQAPPFPYHLLTPRHICHDLVYNPAVTRFMAESAARGAAVKNGAEMLRLQAEAAWRIWQSTLTALSFKLK